VQIVKPDATSEEIDAVFKSGGGSGQVLKSAILTGQASDSIQNAFMTVADKYQDVLTLEASVAELHQVYTLSIYYPISLYKYITLYITLTLCTRCFWTSHC
jgi:t-SNARE complex subunit (syntaxin)